MKVKTAVVILNWNGEQFLKQFLPSVVNFSQGIEVQIFVADNGSTDNSVQFLKADYPEIKVIEFDKNYGFTGGYNKALYQIDAQYFVLLNSDIEVTENWLSRPIELFDSDIQIAAIAPKIKSYHDKTKFEYAGAAGGFVDKYGYPYCRGRILGDIEYDSGQYDDECEIGWASGACLFVRADLYKSVGGLDDDFFAHMEEIDLCLRLKSLGNKIYYTHKSEVFHVGGGTLPNNNPRKLFLNYRNNLLLLYKNLPPKSRFLTIFTRLILDGISAIIYFAKGKFGFFNVVWRAHFAFYALIPKFNKKRQNSENKGVSLNKSLKYSLLWNYYVKKNRTFKNLQ